MIAILWLIGIPIRIFHWIGINTSFSKLPVMGGMSITWFCGVIIYHLWKIFFR